MKRRPKEQAMLRDLLKSTQVTSLLFPSRFILLKRWLFLPLMVLAFGICVYFLFRDTRPPKELEYSHFKELASRHQVSDLHLTGRRLQLRLADGEMAVTEIPPADAAEFWGFLIRNDLKFTLPKNSSKFIQLNWSTSAILLLALIVLALVSWRRPSADLGQTRYLSYGKSHPKLLNTTARKIRLDDLVLDGDTLQHINRLVEFLKEPHKFLKIGAKLPKGFLFVGPPGTGKTYIARALAGTANVPVFHSGGSEFAEMYIGVGASRVRDLFNHGKKNAPCIIFVDEIDALCRPRSNWPNPDLLEREIATSQLLVEIDGMDTSEGVIILASTSRPDLVDPALVRPGRLVPLALNDLRDEPATHFKALLERALHGIPVAHDTDLDGFASVIKETLPHATPASIFELIDRAALLASDSTERTVTNGYLQTALQQLTSETSLFHRAVRQAEEDAR